MAKKKKKTEKKPQQVDQTADLQDSEGREFTENPVEDTENPVTENTEITGIYGKNS